MGKEARVVHLRALLALEPEPLSESQRDQRLPLHVLHRLPEPEIGAERQHREQLGQPHPVLHAGLRPDRV